MPRTSLSPDQLRDLSERLEASAGGGDSIATIERVYLRTSEPDGALRCAYSREATMGDHDCQVRRRDPIAMWVHVHFSRMHGLTWPGCKTPEEAESKMLGPKAVTS